MDWSANALRSNAQPPSQSSWGSRSQIGPSRSSSSMPVSAFRLPDHKTRCLSCVTTEYREYDFVFQRERFLDN